ncbi:MAG: phage tail tape measure protein [Paludibacteraceae bacterium]|nr:phage tail tape measure protein [Paludibacteraceae bacterium]
MSDSTTNTTVNLLVNGQQAAETLTNLRKRASDLQAEIAKAAAEGDKVQLKKLRREFNDVNRQIKQIESSTQQAENVLRRLDRATPQELNKALGTLTKQLNYIERGSVAWDAQTRKIRAVKDELARVNDEMRKSTTWLERFNTKFQEWQTIGAGAIAAATGAVMAGKTAVQAYAEIQQEEANVRKYTGMTEEEVNHLNEAFKQIDTRSSRNQLNKLAQEAGRLGKTSEEDVLGFVKAADQINVALDELGDGATLTLSKLTSIFGDEQRLGTEKSLLAVGSVINELSQNCTASASYLAQFAQRLAGVGAQADMTIPQIMGFAAVLDSQGQKVEMSATALSKLIMNLFKDTDKIAAATGLDLDKFNEALSRSTNEGLLMLIQRLHDLGGIDVLAPVFKDMGENGARASAVISALAANIDMVVWEQQEAQKAFEDATSVTKEFTVQNTTVQAGLDKARKHFAELTIELGQKLMPVMRHVLTTSSMTMRGLSILVDFIIKYRKELLTVITAIAGYTLTVKAATIASKAYAITLAVVNKGQAILQAGAILLKAAFFALTGQINRAKSAMIAFNMLSKANPWGLLVAAISAAVTAITLYVRKQREVTAVDRATKEVNDVIISQYAEEKGKIDRLTAAVNDEKKALVDRRKALDELRKIVPDYHAELTQEGKLIKNNKEAIEDYLVALNKEIALKAYQDKLEEQYRKRAELEMQLDKQTQDRDAKKVAWSGMEITTDRAGNKRAGSAIKKDIAWNKYLSADKDVKKTESALKEVDGVIEAINKKVSEYAEGMKVVKKETEDVVDETVVIPTTEDEPTKVKNKFQAEDDWREKKQALNRIAYAKGEKDFEAYTKRMLEIDVEYHDRKLKHTDLEGNEQVVIEAAYYEALKKQQDNFLQGTAEQENQAYQAQLINLQQRYVDGEMTARQYQNAIELAELQHLQNLVSIYKEGSKERLKAQQNYQRTSLKYQERHIKEDERIQQQLQSQFFTKEFHVADPESYERDMRNLEIVYNQMLQATQDNAKERLKVEKAFHEAKYQLARKYNMKEAAETENSFRSAIDNSIEWLESDGGQAMVQTFNMLVSQMSAIFSSLSDIVQAELDIQTAAIEKRYAQATSDAEGNKYREVQLERQKEKEIAKAKQEANRKMFAMQVLQAIAQTASSAIAAYSSAAAIPMVGFVMAPIAAGMALAAGAIQIAAIKKQQQASEATGYRQGGFTKKGRPDEVAGVVHAGEWVASQALVNDPNARPLINALDYAQRTNSIASLRASDVSRTITAPAVIASAITSERTTPTRQPALRSVSLPKEKTDTSLTDTLALLNRRLSEPFVTVNTVSGDQGIRKAQDEYEQLIKNKTPKSRR